MSSGKQGGGPTSTDARALTSTTNGGRPSADCPRAIAKVLQRYRRRTACARSRPHCPESLGDFVLAETVGHKNHDLGPEAVVFSGRLATRSSL